MGMGKSIHASMPVTLDSGIDQAIPIGGGRTACQRQATTALTDTSSGRRTRTDVPPDVELCNSVVLVGTSLNLPL